MKRLGSIAVATGVLLLTACSIHLDPRVSKRSGAPRQGTVGASTTATGMPQRVGWGTFTVFAIPIAPVSISNGPGERIVMDKVKETLTTAGYQVVDAGPSRTTPRLECDVKRFAFRNYTWLVPIVFTWGKVELDLRLVGGEGSELWKRSYTGSNFNLAYSFSMAANRSMEQILDHVAQDVASDEFFHACCQEPPAVVAP